MKDKTMIVIVSSDDWEGIYINGKLKIESHSLTPYEILSALGFAVSYIELSEEQMEANGSSLPVELTDLAQ